MGSRTTEPPTDADKLGVRLKRPATKDHFRRAKPPHAVVEVLFDPDLAKTWGEATTELERAEATHADLLDQRRAYMRAAQERAKTVRDAGPGDPLPPPLLPAEVTPEAVRDAGDAVERARAAVEALRPVVEDNQREVLLKGLGRAEYVALGERFLPSDGDQAVGAMHGDDFAPALLAQCLVVPAMTEDEVHDLIWDNAALAQWTGILLFTTADALCNQVAFADLGKGSTETTDTGSSSDIA